MKVKCVQCGGEFEARRAGARFCSVRCQVANYRKRRELVREGKAGEKILPSVAEPELEPVQIINRDETPSPEPGFSMAKEVLGRMKAKLPRERVYQSKKEALAELEAWVKGRKKK